MFDRGGRALAEKDREIAAKYRELDARRNQRTTRTNRDPLILNSTRHFELISRHRVSMKQEHV